MLLDSSHVDSKQRHQEPQDSIALYGNRPLEPKG